VYWVEAFSEAYQKWVPVDPLVTKTIGKPSQFEPPASDVENNMTYVIAFEEDGSARDVTRRYAKAYNAKTRKARVEVTKGGIRWWCRVLRMYRRIHASDRDQLEDAELAAKEAAEPMPRNVQDFKSHPYYALERHLRRNEVIHPKREAGKVKAGKSGAGGRNKMLEPVYRRQDIHIVKSADSWYRLGREIKTGEQPLKRVQPRRRREPISEENISGDEENAGTPMYAAFQTTPYIAPPVVRGIVPKNAYGNLDVYVPGMVPPGGAHIPHPDTARAAKLLGIHYADAVTGFEFRGRHGTAVIKGAVVASEYKQAVEEVIRGFEHERAEEEEARRSSNALKMWRMFLKGLRIRERIKGYEIEGEGRENKKVKDDVESEEEDGLEGGFLPDADDGAEAEPTAGQRLRYLPRSYAGEGGGFMEKNSDDDDQRVENLTKPWTETPQAVPQEAADDFGGGGFLPEDDPDDGLEDEGAMEALQDIQSLTDPPIFPDEADDGPEDEDAMEALRDTHWLGDPRSFPATTPQVQREYPVLEAYSLGGNRPRVSQPRHGCSEEEFEEARFVQPIIQSEALEAERRSNQPREAELTPQSDLCANPILEILPGVGQEENTVEMPEEEKFPCDSGDTDEPPQLDHKVNLEEVSTLAAASEEDSETDKGSLLSHDPSDEDADPDWLL